MSYSALLSTYVGSGVFASRPVAATIAATIPPGWIGLWVATDTGALYSIANGDSAWTAQTGASATVTTSLSSAISTVDSAHSTSLSKISSSLSQTNSTATKLSTSLSQVSSSLSGAISSTSSLSTGVSTVISGSISSVNSRVDSLSTASSGALVLLEQHTASGGASIDFSTGFSSTYDEYVFEIVNLLNATNTQRPWIRMSTSGVYDSGANYSDYYHSRNRLSFSGNGSEVDTQVVTMAVDHDNGHSVGICGYVRLFQPLSTTQYKTVMGEFTICNGAGFMENCQFSGWWRNTAAIDGLRFLFSSGNITSGTIRMYGVAK